MVRLYGYGKEWVGFIAGGIAVCAMLFYANGMARGRVRPHPLSWLLWAVVAGVACAAQAAEAAGAAMLTTGFTASACFIIAGLAFGRATEPLTRGDWALLLCALLAIPLWLASENPLLSVMLVTTIDLVAFWPTLRKTWVRPHEESLETYTLLGVTFGLSLLALDNSNLTTMLYPAFLFTANLSFVAMALYRRRALAFSGQ